MPQIFQVLRCYKCLVFQVHQTKKSNKFQCKMCGEKQSINRHYGLGNGQECRKHVQKLNGIRGEMDESKSSQSISTDDEDENHPNVISNVQTHQNKPSKWSDYISKDVEKTESNGSDDDKMYLDNAEVVLELPKKRCKTISKAYDRMQNAKASSDSVQSSDDMCISTTLQRNLASSSCDTKISKVIRNNIFTPPIKKENMPDNKPPSAKMAAEHDDETFNLGQVDALSTQTNITKFVPSAIDKNSKWAKYAEEDVSEENNIEEPSQNLYDHADFPNDVQGLFSLCDDNDLDDFLAI